MQSKLNLNRRAISMFFKFLQSFQVNFSQLEDVFTAEL